MSFGRLERPDSNRPMGDINMTPLIDVMLVLLVIFIITAPLLASSVRVDLPRADAGTAPAAPQVLGVSIAADGTLYLQDTPIALDALGARFAAAAKAQPDTELQLRADKRVPYGVVAQVMAAAQKAGVQRIGFVTDPAGDAPQVKP
ncbi:MAG: biopolymer transporter ExbD [Betaproteobacteria bacterium]|nr:biopolymer transporter ExbD [Betaproteobacteria bacterium]